MSGKRNGNNIPASWYDRDCRRCPRLVDFLSGVKAQFPDYACRPVPPFGDPAARLLIVGLAPGKHGANATGRPFTGDFAGVLLYRTLYRFGLTSRADSIGAGDGLVLHGCRITNAVKCLPPQNRPATDEVKECNGYLRAELQSLAAGSVVLSLGQIAFGAVLRALDQTIAHYKFRHGAAYIIDSPGIDSPGIESLVLLASYHCSRYNTQTGRLTSAMFEEVVHQAVTLLDGSHPD